MELVFTVLALLSSIALIGSVTFQDSAEQGLGTIGGDATPLWGQAKGQSRNDVLKRVTIISAVVFIISHLALVAIK